MLQEECQLDPDEKDVVDLKHSSTICSTSPPEPLSPPPPPIVPGSIASLEAQAECADLPPIPTSSRPRSSCFSRQQQQHRHTSDVLLEEPYIYDPGSGPRVRNARVFLDSYFALPVSSDDALCEEFGKDEVRDMLLSVLPEELALTLWYNKSRLTGRVCPTCRRLYRVGDALHDLTLGPQDKSDQPPLSKNNSPPAVLDQLRNEQDLSGLCSPICFIMASYSFPAAMKATWGRTADELDDDTWAMLNSPGSISGKPSDPSKAGEGDPFLGLIVRMTRLADLGLAQMLFPGEAMEQGDDQWEGEEEERGKSKREEVVDLSDEVD
ncbi:hypothetical protein BDV98DRAFT_517099 [Pterulicium gracile]|uniref:Uncharacterized protein n=1 Tax=Pterulicium gracile TaxID=1884261 RepID=A0A5C3Q3I0_9AGAR|nr:hypothetical protein BDV98DRAFT_517099 [Pterula gracilis]